MLILDGYSLTYDVERNHIVIGLPQTYKTFTNSMEPVADRRVDVDESELAELLLMAMRIFGRESVDAGT